MAVTVTETVLFFLFSFLAFLFTISVHESAHALVADRCGDPTARQAGRVSLNPLRHMELFGTVVLPLMTSLSGLATFGWAKPTPVNVSKLRNPRRDDMLVSAAGPASNLLTALFCLALLKLIGLASADGARVVDDLALTGLPGPSGSVLNPVAWLLHRLLEISVVLGVFNLFPVPPLDGSHILQHLLPLKARLWYRSVGRYGVIILLLVLWYTPLSQWAFDRPMRLVNSLLRM
jgi:Zn-dependent protease